MSWGQTWNTFNWGATVAQSVTGTDVQQDLLGVDLLFQNDYAISPKGDYVLVDGLAALRQSILHRLVTSPGEFRTRPTYGVGLPRFVKKPRNPTNLRLIERRVEEQLAREPRVEEVLEVAVTDIEDGVKVSIAVRAAGKSLRFQPFIFNELGERALEV